MKKILILLVVLAAIAGIAYYKGNERNSRLHRSIASVKARELLFPDFENNINGIKKIHVKDDKAEATLVVQNDMWVVADRGGYPLDKEKLQTALLSLQYEKIKAGRHIGKDSWGKVGVNAPGSAAGAGMLVELFADKDALKYSFVLGGQVTSSGGSNNDQMQMFGGPKGNRFIRIQGEDTIWEIHDQLPDLVTKPDAWLAKAFFDVQKLKSVEVTMAKPEDSWKAARTEEAGDFILEGAKPGEKIDAGKVSLGTLLSSPAFNDVLSKDKATATMKDAVKAKLVTFEGFTYNVQVVKLAGQGGGDKYYLTVSVSADLPKERAAVKDEKPEDKKKNDEAFAAEKTKLEEKLASEKKFEGWVYEVTEYTVSSLLKKRAEILAAPPPANQPPPDAGGSTRPAGLPDIKKMIPGLNMSPPPGVPSSPTAPAAPPAVAPSSPPPLSVTTPAVPLPAPVKPEIKPAPAPGADPITGEKPAAPAPAPAAEPSKPAAPAPAAEPAAPAKP